MVVAEHDDLTLWDDEIRVFNSIATSKKRSFVVRDSTHMTLYSDLTKLEVLAREGRAWADAPPTREGVADGPRRWKGRADLGRRARPGRGRGAPARARVRACVIGDVLDEVGDEVAAESATARLRSRSTSGAPRTGSARSRRAARFGRLDGLVNNAGISRAGPIETMPLEEYSRS